MDALGHLWQANNYWRGLPDDQEGAWQAAADDDGLRLNEQWRPEEDQPHTSTFTASNNDNTAAPPRHMRLSPSLSDGFATTSPVPDILDAILNNGSSALSLNPAQQQLEARSSRAEQYISSLAGSAQPPAQASHQDDWLDRAIQLEPYPMSDFPQRYFATAYHERSSPPPPSPSASSSEPESTAYQEFVTVEDSDEDGQEESDVAMPARTRRSRPSFVDLTQDSPPMPAHTVRPNKRRAEESSSGEGSQAAKRGRISLEGVEEIDLAEEKPSAEEALLEAQQREAIRSQQAATEEDGPQRIGKRSCVICMENFTNITATHCGHFYCHECLIRSLMAGEKTSDRGIGNCPICRKSVSRSARSRHNIIPIAFMKKEAFELNRLKRRVAQEPERPRSRYGR